MGWIDAVLGNKADASCASACCSGVTLEFCIPGPLSCAIGNGIFKLGIIYLVFQLRSKDHGKKLRIRSFSNYGLQ